MLLHDIIENCGVVPVVVLEDANKAVPLARALLAGGMPTRLFLLQRPYSREESRPARLLLELLPQKKPLGNLH